MDYLRTQYKVSDFISWKKSKTLEINPNFQRRSVWKPGEKSYFMDTIIKGLPVPIIILRDKIEIKKLESKREVIDGQQRIRTILSFIDPSLLEDYSQPRDYFTIKEAHNKELANKGFLEMPEQVKQDIIDYQFSVHVLPSDVDDREVLQIFWRMNATGVKLNRQELRNSKYFGYFKSSMYDIASEQLPRWRKWGIFTEYNIARMDEVELTSEFVMLMLKGLTGKGQTAIDNIYGSKDEEFREKAEVEKRFRSVLDAIDDNIGNELIDLPFKKKTLFYGLFAFFYDIQFGIGSELKRSKGNPISADLINRIKLAGEEIENKKAKGEVISAVERRTTNLKSRRILLDYLHSLTKGA